MLLALSAVVGLAPACRRRNVPSELALVKSTNQRTTSTAVGGKTRCRDPQKRRKSGNVDERVPSAIFACECPRSWFGVGARFVAAGARSCGTKSLVSPSVGWASWISVVPTHHVVLTSASFLVLQYSWKPRPRRLLRLFAKSVLSNIRFNHCIGDVLTVTPQKFVQPCSISRVCFTLQNECSRGWPQTASRPLRREQSCTSILW